MAKKIKSNRLFLSIGLLGIIILLAVYFSPEFFLGEAQQTVREGVESQVKGKVLKWFPFNKKTALKEWQEKVFKDRVLYTIETKQQDGFLKAASRSASSGIFYRLGFNPKKYPFISWKWKVLKFPEKNKQEALLSAWIEKDDYAARVYVIFPSVFFSRTQCLEYVWDKDLPAAKIMTSPYFKNIKIIVAESGAADLGKWVFVERNIREDYKRAFGREPGSVGAVAIMTDSDNTLSTAEADYDEIRVGYKK